jgi:hypothetical protein
VGVSYGGHPKPHYTFAPPSLLCHHFRPCRGPLSTPLQPLLPPATWVVSKLLWTSITVVDTESSAQAWMRCKRCTLDPSRQFGQFDPSRRVSCLSSLCTGLLVRADGAAPLGPNLAVHSWLEGLELWGDSIGNHILPGFGPPYRGTARVARETEHGTVTCLVDLGMRAQQGKDTGHAGDAPLHNGASSGHGRHTNCCDCTCLKSSCSPQPAVIQALELERFRHVSSADMVIVYCAGSVAAL